MTTPDETAKFIEELQNWVAAKDVDPVVRQFQCMFRSWLCHVKSIQADIEKLKQERYALSADLEKLNQMLRQTGYSQGQIDVYVAVCEEHDALLAKVREIRDRYAEDIFSPDSQTVEAAVARLARGICGEILDAAKGRQDD